MNAEDAIFVLNEKCNILSGKIFSLEEKNAALENKLVNMEEELKKTNTQLSALQILVNRIYSRVWDSSWEKNQSHT